VASVVGIGGLLGALGSTAFQPIAGHLRDLTGNYKIPLIGISFFYLISLLIIHLLVPKLEPATFEEPSQKA
jgi:ACS family hexuronate transporter-like MFS transporter